MRIILATTTAMAALFAQPALAATVFDATGDFLPTYTAGPKLADLDVTSFSVNYDSVAQIFTLGASFAGVINEVSNAGIYVIGVNTGAGALRPFAALGQENVIFDRAITLRKDGTGSINGAALNPADITIVGNLLTARVALSFLPPTVAGFRPQQYGFNLWPRIGTGNNNQITDFSPENANLSVEAAVPEPATWASMIAGFFGIGVTARRRRATALA